MVKLTVELIEQAAQYTNPVRDRELDLRGAIVRQTVKRGPAGCGCDSGWRKSAAVAVRRVVNSHDAICPAA